MSHSALSSSHVPNSLYLLLHPLIRNHINHLHSWRHRQLWRQIVPVSSGCRGKSNLFFNRDFPYTIAKLRESGTIQQKRWGDHTNGKKRYLSSVPDQSRSTDSTSRESTEAHRKPLETGGVAPDLLRAPRRARLLNGERTVRYGWSSPLSWWSTSSMIRSGCWFADPGILFVPGDGVSLNQRRLRTIVEWVCGRLTGV
jgi:hypothetical protein